MRRRPRLSTQIVLLQCTIVLLSVGVGLAVSLYRARTTLNEQTGSEALGIAKTVASIPAVRRGFAEPKPWRTIDPIAERVRKMTGAAFVVVANRQGIRYSHPNPKLLGKSLLHDPGENPAAVLSGKTFIGVQNGSLGRSVRAKVPIYDLSDRHVIGLVSVGVLERTVSARMWSDLPVVLIPPLAGFLLGGIGSVLLARRIKRQTFGLEPNEITALLEQREAMLHGIREGAIATDPQGRITLLNDEAERLLGLPPSVVGRQLDDVVPVGRLRDVLLGKIDGPDQVVLVGDRVLVANQMPVEIRGRAIGSVVTLRDRTELESLLRELDDVRGLAEALRAQEHEFAHRLHVISGLIELERYDDAVQMINRTSVIRQTLAASLAGDDVDSVLAALLLGKAAIAGERGVELAVRVEPTLLDELADVPALVTVLGNLIDNALDAVAGEAAGSAKVDVAIAVADGELTIRVHDSGPGVDPSLVDEIFRDGFTTKVAQGPVHRGLGLALVAQEVRRAGGRIAVTNDDGAVFEVVLPLPAGRVAVAGGVQ